MVVHDQTGVGLAPAAGSCAAGWQQGEPLSVWNRLVPERRPPSAARLACRLQVNPIAVNSRFADVFTRNKRSVLRLRSPDYGDVAYVAIGATASGRQRRPGPGSRPDPTACCVGPRGCACACVGMFRVWAAAHCDKPVLHLQMPLAVHTAPPVASAVLLVGADPFLLPMSRLPAADRGLHPLVPGAGPGGREGSRGASRSFAEAGWPWPPCGPCAMCPLRASWRAGAARCWPSVWYWRDPGRPTSAGPPPCRRATLPLAAAPSWCCSRQGRCPGTKTFCRTGAPPESARLRCWRRQGAAPRE